MVQPILPSTAYLHLWSKLLEDGHQKPFGLTPGKTPFFFMLYSLVAERHMIIPKHLLLPIFFSSKIPPFPSLLIIDTYSLLWDHIKKYWSSCSGLHLKLDCCFGLLAISCMLHPYSSLHVTLPLPFLDHVFELNIVLRLLNNHCMDWPEILYLVLLVCYLDGSNSKSSNSTYSKTWFSTC